MSTSLPSQTVHSLNAPEPIELAVDFVYNFFVADEGIEGASVVGTHFVNVDVDEFDESFELFARRRVSRYVKLSWSLPRSVPTSALQKGELTKHVRKIVDESSLSSKDYFSVLLADPSIADRVHGFVSGSLSLQNLGRSTNASTLRKVATRSSGSVSTSTEMNIVTAGLQQLQREFGASFFDADGIELKDGTWDSLARVSSVVQISSKFADHIIRRAMLDPHSPYTAELRQIADESGRLSEAARSVAAGALTDAEFRSYVPYVSIERARDVPSSAAGSASVVGFIVDKIEHLPDGSTRAHDPIVVDAPGSRSIIDLNVRYGATYSYTVRSVVLATAPAVDDDTNDVALIDFLVSSRPASRAIVRCIELKAPPPPSDVGFVWDHEREQLVVSWMHPVNSQRDIKEYQVFRRSSLDEPFRLLKVYRFNDALVRNDLTVHAVEEGIDSRVVEIVSSPRLSFVDPEFDRSSSFVYTVCSVDAHGLTSNYSAQHRIGFDRFKNALTRELVSHTGAPKSYPNMYLEVDLFNDAIRVSGPASRRFRLYFNPEFYDLRNADGSVERVVATQQDGGRYVLQMINTDSQKVAKVEITVDDRRRRR